MPLPAILGIVGRAVLGATARGGATSGIRKALLSRAVGGAYRATGASSVPMIEKAVEAGRRGYDAYRQHQDEKQERKQAPFDPDPRERREDETASRHREGHEEAIRNQERTKIDESARVLERMSEDVAVIKEAITGKSEGDSFLGKTLRGLISIPLVIQSLFGKIVTSIFKNPIFGGIASIVSKVGATFSNIMRAIATSRIGKMLGMSAVATVAGVATSGEAEAAVTPAPSQANSPLAPTPSVPASSATRKQELLESGSPMSPVSSSGPLEGVGASPLANLIGHHESRNNYNAYNIPAKNSKGETYYRPVFNGANLENMSIGQVRQMQRERKLFAAGRYQIIPKTLDELMSYTPGLTWDSKFDQAAQDKLFQSIITRKRPAIGRYLNGDQSARQEAAKQISQEWAGVAAPAGVRLRNGQIGDGQTSYYSGIGGNKAGASSAQALSALDGSRNSVLAAAPSRQGQQIADASKKARQAESRPASAPVAVPVPTPTGNKQASAGTNRPLPGIGAPMATRNPDAGYRALALGYMAQSA